MAEAPNATGGNNPAPTAGGGAPAAYQVPTAVLAGVPTFGDALAAEQWAKANFQLENVLNGDKETLSNARTAYAYNNSLVNQAEPKDYARNRYQAVNEGIAQSGLNAERRGEVAQGLQNRRNTLTTGLLQTEQKVQRSAQEAQNAYNQNVAAYTKGAEERARERTLKEAPQEPAQPQMTALQAAAAGLPAPGGVISQVTKTPGGSVATGNATRAAREARERAAKKAAAGG